MEEWRNNCKAILKDIIANPPGPSEDLVTYLNQKADLITGYMPEVERKKREKPEKPE